MAVMAVGVISTGLGFVLADGVDRFLATYNPAATTAPPTDRFTSSGSGTLANTLNVAARPNWKRVAAGVGMFVAPAAGAYYIKQPMVRASMEGLAVGAGIAAFKTLWNNFFMPMLAPKDSSPAALQKSFIARLYPAEVASHINTAINPGATAVASSGSGALSGAPQDANVGVSGGSDVGPFALAEPQFPTVQQQLGAGDPDWGGQNPTVAQHWGTGRPGSDHPTMAQVLGAPPGPPQKPDPGPQAQPHTEPQCGCGDPTIGFAGFIGDEQQNETFFQ